MASVHAVEDGVLASTGHGGRRGLRATTRGSLFDVSCEMRIARTPLCVLWCRREPARASHFALDVRRGVRALCVWVPSVFGRDAVIPRL